jgi:hypothetical protein
VGDEEKAVTVAKDSRRPFPSQEAINAAEIIVDIAGSPGKRKAPAPDDDQED